ncbi:MAG: leucyl/phenylalanyl-tRNA--protein transferase [Actinomycetota bacterium]|nr:leucyl/phenylalanyl-tRNA--protein transferase [Actinomycetota bacterium]
MPSENLPPSRWDLPPAESADEDGLVGVGADLEPATLIDAYRHGLFPMPLAGLGPPELLGWWSPDPRAVLPLDGLRVTRSLRRSRRRFEVRLDTAFAEVIAACADPSRDGTWISPAIEAAYLRLHQLGWAHSIEAWTPDGNLAGGLYGVAVGGLFAGESMFHRTADASKVALMGLVEVLGAGGATLLDVQWTTPHLRSLGAVDLPRRRYLELLAHAVRQPLPAVFAGGSTG